MVCPMLTFYLAACVTVLWSTTMVDSCALLCHVWQTGFLVMKLSVDMGLNMQQYSLVLEFFSGGHGAGMGLKHREKNTPTEASGVACVCCILFHT